MADSQEMRRVDMAKELPNLSETDRHFVKKLEKVTLNRAQQMKDLRKGNRRFAFLLGALAIGVYAYTIGTFKQEHFEDFDEIPDQVKKEGS